MISTQPAEADEESVTVTPIKIRETRVLQLDKTAEDSFPTSSNLTITLLLKGKAVEPATHWGKLKIKRAVDDQGNSLKLGSRKFFGSFDEFNKIDDSFTGFRTGHRIAQT